MSYVKRYWRFYFFYSSIFLVWSLTDVSICLYALWKAMHKCWWFGYEDEDSYEAEGRFSVSFTILQEGPAKKIAVELKPIKKKPQQMKLRAKSRPEPLRTSKISWPAAPPIPSEDLPPPPPRRPRSTCSSTSDLSHYVVPESTISSNLDKRSPEFRVGHVRYFQKLKEDGFPMLDMTAYYTANESSLGVKLRRFHQFGSGNMRTIYKRMSKKRSQNRRSRGIKTKSFVKLSWRDGQLDIKPSNIASN